MNELTKKLFDVLVDKKMTEDEKCAEITLLGDISKSLAKSNFVKTAQVDFSATKQMQISLPNPNFIPTEQALNAKQEVAAASTSSAENDNSTNANPVAAPSAENSAPKAKIEPEFIPLTSTFSPTAIAAFLNYYKVLDVLASLEADFSFAFMHMIESRNYKMALHLTTLAAIDPKMDAASFNFKGNIISFASFHLSKFKKCTTPVDPKDLAQATKMLSLVKSINAMNELTTLLQSEKKDFAAVRKLFYIAFNEDQAYTTQFILQTINEVNSLNNECEHPYLKKLILLLRSAVMLEELKDAEAYPQFLEVIRVLFAYDYNKKSEAGTPLLFTSKAEKDAFLEPFINELDIRASVDVMKGTGNPMAEAVLNESSRASSSTSIAATLKTTGSPLHSPRKAAQTPENTTPAVSM